MTIQNAWARDHRARGTHRPAGVREDELARRVRSALDQRLDQGAGSHASHTTSHSRQLAWVRPDQLLSAGTARMARLGIDAHAGMARRLRSLPVAVVRGKGESARRLTPARNPGRPDRDGSKSRRSPIELG